MAVTSTPVRNSPAAGQVPRARRRPLLAFHIAAAGSAIGAELALLVLGVSGLAGTEPARVYPAMETVGRWVLVPAAVAILVSGIVLARASHYGLTRYWWVVVKLVTTTVLATLAGLVLAPALTRAADAAITAAALPDGQRLALVMPAAIGLSLMLLSVGLGVFKPRWRLPRASR